MTSRFDVSRRSFLKTGASAGMGLIIALHVPGLRRLGAMQDGSAAAPPDPFSPNVWLRIASDGMVTVTIAKSEMGQGVHTALAMLVAEELDAAWSSVRIEQADADPKYGEQTTAGSLSVAQSWEPLRKAGAAARQMLVAAAAERWKADADNCRTESGQVIHVPSGRQLEYGVLADRASRFPVPENPRLKQPAEFRLIGKPTLRIDASPKVDGRARYGLDVRVPGMLYACMVRPPMIGGKVRDFDAGSATAVPGVRSVHQVEIPADRHTLRGGVAVVADSTWAAMRGARALSVRWDEGPLVELSSTKIARSLAADIERPGLVLRDDGDAERALGLAATRVDAEYSVPYLAHAPMEPLNCVAHVQGERCELWAPTQVPDSGRRAVASVLGLKPESVTVHVTYLGGGFGRRLFTDYMVEASQISRLAGSPVQLVWTREDEIRHGFYRPTSLQRVRGGVDREGRIIAWDQVIAGPSIDRYLSPEPPAEEAAPYDIIQGIEKAIYGIPNLRQRWVYSDPGVPVGWWRSVGHSQNAFVIESMIDELAAAAGRDPVELRRTMLRGNQRHLAALDLAARRSGWGSPLPDGRGRGIALHETFDTVVAEVAEVAVEDGRVRVHRVICAVDCGTVVNPAGVVAQMESGVAFALSAVLHGEITIDRGRVKQSNFHDYPLLRGDEMPEVEVYLVPSARAPSGAGEPGVPPLAPAVANGVYAATGRRIRRLPIRLGG